MKKTKQISISWAYPTSPAAVAFNKIKTGCFVLEFIDEENHATLDRSFDTEKEAYEYADKLGMPYSRYDLREYHKRSNQEARVNNVSN